MPPKLRYSSTFIIVNEVHKLLLSPPQINQLGDEVDARLNRMHKARFQRDGKTLALAAELRTLGLTVIAYPELTQVLHIVHIHTPSYGPVHGDKTRHAPLRARHLRHCPSSIPALSAPPPSLGRKARTPSYRECPGEAL